MIHIKDNYYIGADTAQFTLLKKTIVQEGRTAGAEIISTVGYYSTVPFALKSYIKVRERELVNANNCELSEAVDLFENLDKEMSALFDKLKGA